ncbi:MAG: hypothetical protein J6X02_06045 [Bacilli bacterium]|nr:hypothetical protein [Bacilli bacterium]
MKKLSKKDEEIIRSRKELDHGDFGTVYINDDGTLTKVFNYEMYKCPVDIMIKLRELNLDFFYGIGKIYYRLDGNNKYVKGYVLYNIEPENINILDIKLTKLIINLRKLIESFEILSRNSILVHDVREKNTIINSEGIHIIDCDGFRFDYNFTFEMIENYNLKQLYRLFYDLFLDAVSKKGLNSRVLSFKIYDLFKNNFFNADLNEFNGYETMGEYLAKK